MKDFWEVLPVKETAGNIWKSVFIWAAGAGAGNNLENTDFGLLSGKI